MVHADELQAPKCFPREKAAAPLICVASIAPSANVEPN
ncbi:hypothetical protein APY04_1260 [Hyphomicrobium sulfonivorans]|uniref:Uncharacterized protein n=1 Tax=Hyphomicrobium sulfonivorans TaxID=121290 RepID=A0A109BJZ0_HYPSL|nr:hypothetical protein APY04_1260 [Hyphomicrobium sulfonivorans]